MVLRISQPSGPTLKDVSEALGPLAPVWHHAQIRAPKIQAPKNHDYGGSTDGSRSPELQVTLFIEI